MFVEVRGAAIVGQSIEPARAAASPRFAYESNIGCPATSGNNGRLRSARETDSPFPAKAIDDGFRCSLGGRLFISHQHEMRIVLARVPPASSKSKLEKPAGSLADPVRMSAQYCLDDAPFSLLDQSATMNSSGIEDYRITVYRSESTFVLQEPTAPVAIVWDIVAKFCLHAQRAR
jgi:hypothetical protein